ncbi:hypothetical protein HOLleu_00591 [Holothuria leucospilota]|uniref:Uncharacterized protein n=1 Tax=Holothuria leucospilota TaxID=206669 RepID=A0A9Q1CNV0_HOLLE|nr:hypothetical protein HOLleu_00591 [Holothuria leucospilota]
MNTLNYINEAETQLKNEEFYRPLPSDLTETLKKKLHELLQNQNPDIQSAIKDLIPPYSTPSRFFTLPKIHKLKTIFQERFPDVEHTDIIRSTRLNNMDPPGRPIVSGTGTLTEYISAFVDGHLQTILPKLPTLLQDTNDFLRKLNNVDILPKGPMLVTLDVKSL